MKHFHCSGVALVCMLMLQTPAASAQSVEDEEDLVSSYGDKSFVSIATGSQQQLRRAPAVTTVITTQDIAAMGATDLDEVMETVPGMHVNRSVSTNNPLYVMRGIFSQFAPQTLVMQNGVPVTTLLVGSKGNLWGGYPLEHIARIEIIRGPGSALYGADAYAGVVNIITKNAADTPGTQIGARLGSFNTRDAWIQHGGNIGSVDVAAYLRVGRSDGFKETIAADAQTRTDRIFGTTASLAPGPLNTGYDAVDGNLDFGFEKWQWRVGYKLRDNLGTGAGVASALDPVGKEKSERITSDLSWTDNQFAKDWGVGVVGSYLHYAQLMPTYLQLLPPGTTFPTGSFPNGMIGAPETWERQLRLSSFVSYSGFANHSLRVGLGHDDLNMYQTAEHRNFTYAANGTPIPTPGGAPVLDFSDTAPFILPQRRMVDYVYAQDEWNFAKDWTLTSGLRHDHYSDFGSTNNPRLALVWDAAQNVTTKFLYGCAFRAPAFAEVYGVTNPVAIGNLNLRPETICTKEVALAWQARKDVQVNVNVFDYTMKDIIRTVPNTVPNTGSTYNNTGDQTGQGAELEAVWVAARSLRLSGHYAYQRSVDKATDQDAGYAPHHHVYGRADWGFTSDWQLSGQVNYVADRKRAANDLRADIPNYTTMDLTLRTERGKGRVSFATSIRNVFDADVREPSLAPGTAIPNDLPMARRSLYVQAVFQL